MHDNDDDKTKMNIVIWFVSIVMIMFILCATLILVSEPTVNAIMNGWFLVVGIIIGVLGSVIVGLVDIRESE